MSYQSTAVADIAVSKRTASFARGVNLAIFAIVALGAVLRIVQYAANPSLWLDEIALVKGILALDFVGLFARQLPFDQVAPKGFLFAQKLAVLAFGPSDYVLRFVPFMCSLVALVAFSRFAQRALSPVGALVATLLFATAAPFIAFAGIVKQYSVDVCVAVVLSWLALDLITRPVTEPKAWRAAIAGAILQWFSQPAVLMVGALACPVVLWVSTDPPDARRRRVAIVLALWGASALAVTAATLATMSPETRDYMRAYWADGFVPASLARVVELRWPWPNIRLLFGFGAQAALAYPLSPLYPALAVIGLGILWVRQRRVALIVLAPLVVTLGAAFARQYPFSDRLILFLVPSLMIAIAAVSAAVYGFVERFSKPAALLAVVGLTVPAVVPVARLRPPYRVEDMKYVLGQIQARRQPTDTVYVYYGAAPAMSVYDSTFGYSRGAYAVGGCHRGDSRGYLEELDTFRGDPRVWVVLTHSLFVYREREDILAYLDTIGTRMDYVSIPSRAVGRNPLPAEGFLFDLSAAPRLARADAGSFKLTGPNAVNHGDDCANGVQAMIRSDFACTGPPRTRCTRRPLAGS